MRAFDIFVNGKRQCVVGIGSDGVLSTTITYAPWGRRHEIRLHVGGLVMPGREHVRWKQSFLRVGDEVKLKVVEREAVDKPRKRYRADPAAELEAQKRDVRERAKKLGWKIQEKRK